MFRRIPLLVILLALAATAPLQAGENLRKELSALAQQIKSTLESEQADAITVGAFTGSSRLNSSSGPSIQMVLSEELKKVNVTVKPGARYEVKGDYMDMHDEESRQTGIKIVARIFNLRTGEDIIKFARLAFGNPEVIDFSGVTAELGPTGTQAVRNRKLVDKIDNPTCHLDGSKVTTEPKCPYAVEITVRSGGRYVPRKPTLVDGQAFVQLRKGDVFAVKIINNSDYEAAVTISLDGINLFAFSEVRAKDGKPFNYLILASKQSYEVKGWHINFEKIDEFLVTDYTGSAAHQLNSAAGLGTITVQFAAAWEKYNRSTMPPDEPSTRGADIAIGRGKRVDEKSEAVERDIGITRSVISIRYTK